MIEWLFKAYYMAGSSEGKNTFVLFSQDKEDSLTINDKVVAFERNGAY